MKNEINKIIKLLQNEKSLEDSFVSLYEHNKKLNVLVQDSDCDIRLIYIFNGLDIAGLKANKIIYTGFMSNLCIENFNPEYYTDVDTLMKDFEKSVARSVIYETYGKSYRIVDCVTYIRNWINLFKDFDVDYTLKMAFSDEEETIIELANGEYWDSEDETIENIEEWRCSRSRGSEYYGVAYAVLEGNSKKGLAKIDMTHGAEEYAKPEYSYC